MDDELLRDRDRLADRGQSADGGRFGIPTADVASADTLVIVHMVCIGWPSMAMCGALFQFVPVLVGKPLYDERWELPALVLLTARLTALLAGFLVLGGLGCGCYPSQRPCWPRASPLSSPMMTVWRARPPFGPAHFVLAGLASLCATVALGTGFAWSLSGHGGEELGKPSPWDSGPNGLRAVPKSVGA